MKRMALASMIAVFALGCASVRVTTDFDPSVDFSAYRTYSWLPEPTEKTGDPRLDNPLLARRVVAALEAELAARSFRKEASGKADFLVGYHLSLKQRLDVHTIDGRYGYGPAWHGAGPTQTYVTEYEQGTLLIDFVDAGRKSLVWRGSGSRRIPQSPSPDQSAENIRRAVAEILAKFPPAR